MEFTFIDRRGTGCEKWDGVADVFPGMDTEGAVPMWVADMDFQCPSPVVEAVVERARAGIYGYSTGGGAEFTDAVVSWMKRRHGWDIDPEWIIFTPGVVPALTCAVQALTEPGEGVIIQPPVYYPFRNSVVNNDRALLNNSLILDDGGYRMDYDGLEELAARPDAKLMILCSPHNPVGRVWDREELARLCAICARHGVTLVSDEIHADLTLSGTSFAATGPLAAEAGTACISCYAPSKTFNMAGIQASVILISDPEVRAAFRKQRARNSLPGMNSFAEAALVAAWNHGEAYIKEVMDYIEANMDHAIDFFRRHTPKIRMEKPQGTYLGWVDLRGLGLDADEADRFFVERAKIAADLGRWFGPEGAGFIRVNFACHRSTLDQALEQLRAAYDREF